MCCDKERETQFLISVSNEIEKFKDFAKQLEKEGGSVDYILKILKHHIQRNLGMNE